MGGPLLLSAHRPLVHTGHCRQRRQKAFICNRVGDFGFLIGILTLWALTNTLDFSLMEIPAGISENLLNITVLCLFCGAVGKSAQFPLHVWLPDAMEGPTPSPP
ncbi:hypothetical protein M5E88_15030 [Akkermansia muciniphila]|nr:hypothetical protein M5E88_15030 [Akkermansia muciniphila]